MEILIPVLIALAVFTVLGVVIKRSLVSPRRRKRFEGDSTRFTGSDPIGWIGSDDSTLNGVDSESSPGEGFGGGGDFSGGGSGGSWDASDGSFEGADASVTGDDFSGGGDFGGGDSGGDSGGGDSGGGD